MPNTRTLAARLQKLIATAPSPPLTRFNTTLSRAVASAPNSATAARYASDDFGLDDRDPRHAGTEGDEAGLDRDGESDGRPQPECPRALHVHGLGWCSIGLRRSLVRGPGGRRSSSAC